MIDWTDDMDAQLGTATDAAIAARLGAPKHAVWRRRNELGIEPYRKHGPADVEEPPVESKPTPRVAWAHEVGTRPDAAIARDHGVSRQRVHTYRTRRGIPAYDPTAPTLQRPDDLPPMLEQLLDTLGDARKGTGLTLDELAEGLDTDCDGLDRRLHGLAPWPMTDVAAYLTACGAGWRGLLIGEPDDDEPTVPQLLEAMVSLRVTLGLTLDQVAAAMTTVARKQALSRKLNGRRGWTLADVVDYLQACGAGPWDLAAQL